MPELNYSETAALLSGISDIAEQLGNLARVTAEFNNTVVELTETVQELNEKLEKDSTNG